MRDQGVEAVAEGDGGDHDDDGEDGPEDGRAHRHRVAPCTRLEGEADADHRRDRQSRIGRCPGRTGSPRAPPAPAHGPVRARPDDQGGRGGAEPDDEYRARPRRAPSSRRTRPGSGYDRPHRPDRASGESATATPAARSEPTTTAPRIPISAVARRSWPDRRRGPGASRSSLLPSRTWRPMTWTAMSSAASAAMAPNTPRAMDSGLMARCALPQGVGRSAEGGKRLREDGLDLALHRGHVAAAAAYLDAGLRVVDTAGQERPGERRREIGQRLGVVDVVFDQLSRFDHGAHQRHGDPSDRADLGGAERGEIRLGVGVDPERDALHRRGDPVVGPPWSP